MNIITNNCLYGFFCKQRKLQYQNPFVWNMINSKDFERLIRYYDELNFEDVEIKVNKDIIKNFLSITYVRNTGAAFSILENNRILLIIISICALIYILYYLSKKKLEHIDYLSFSFLIAGIVGNLIDRLLHGYVIDYIDFRIINFPIFNFADSLIIIGAIILFISSFKGEKYEISNRK